MQTFLIGSSEDTATILDDKRLFKQLLEGKQILDVIVSNKKAWSNHPAVRQWKDYPHYLFSYICSIRRELNTREIAMESKLFAQCNELIQNCDIVSTFPKWINRIDIHSSHRSRLLSKGFVDAMCVDLKRDLKIKSINDWLKLHYKKDKNQLRYDDALKIKKDFPLVNFQTPNYYEQFGWNDDIRADYIWPI